MRSFSLKFLLLLLTLLTFSCSTKKTLTEAQKTEVRAKSEEAQKGLEKPFKQEIVYEQPVPKEFQNTTKVLEEDEENVITVTVEGQSQIYAEDFLAAKDQAITHAKKQAVEFVHGTKIDSEIRLVDVVLVDNTIINKANGLVKSYKLLNEKISDNIFTVSIEAKVYKNPNQLQEEFRRNFTSIVGITTVYDGDDNKSIGQANRVENLLAKDLANEGYEIQDKEKLLVLADLSEKEKEGIRSNKFSENEEFALKFGSLGLSNLVIYGKAVADSSASYSVPTYDFLGSKKGNLFFYRATLDLTIFEVSTQKTIAKINVGGIKGLKAGSSTREKAVFKALEKCYEEAKPKIIQKLKDYKGDKSRLVQIEVKNIPTYEEYKILKQAFESIRFKESPIEEKTYSKFSSTFTFVYSENISFIATKFDNHPKLSLVEKKQNKVSFEFLKD